MVHTPLVALALGSLTQFTSAQNCCWSKWGDASSCGGYSGSGGLCNTDWTKSCSSDTDCPDSPAPSPSPVPTPTPSGLSRVLLVGLYKNWGATVNSYSLQPGNSVPQLLSSSDIGTNSPSWITAAGPRAGDLASVFAVSETDNTVSSLTLDCGGSLSKTSTVSSQGAGPVFIATDSTTNNVFCANYRGGTVGVLPVAWNSDGTAKLGEATQTLQFGASAHAHSAYFTDSGVFVPTLGLDQVQQLQFQNGQLTQAHDPLMVQAQQGPRHMAFHPSLPIAVLANEGAADATVTIELLSVDGANGLSNIATYTASGPYNPPDLYPAEVLFSPNGDLVLVSVRDASDQKRDGIAVFGVEDNGASLGFVGYTNVGHYPRSMALTPEGVLIVGNQKDNSLSVLSLDLSSGVLTHDTDLNIGDSPAFVGVFDLAEGCAAKAVLV